MPVYFFGLPDDLASPEVSEELANDAEAKRVAQIVANDLSRDTKFGRGPLGLTKHSFQNTYIQKDFTKSREHLRGRPSKHSTWGIWLAPTS